MRSVFKSTLAIVAAISLAFVSAIPARAGTSEVWKTTSSGDWVGIADVGQKVAVNVGGFESLQGHLSFTAEHLKASLSPYV